MNICEDSPLSVLCLVTARSAATKQSGANQARRKSALRRRRIAKPIAPKPSSIIAHVAGSGTAATTPADVALTKLEVNGPVVLIR